MTRRLPVLAVLALAVVALVGACGNQDDGGAVGAASTGSSGASTTAASKGDAKAAVQVAKTGLGEVLVDDRGHTLYLFTKDSNGASACTGACASTWPPLEAGASPTVGAGLDAAKLGTLARADGMPQLTYAGKPLYRYGPDQKAGDTNGQGVGGVWFAVRPDGSAASATGSSTAGGYSY